MKNRQSFYGLILFFALQLCARTIWADAPGEIYYRGQLEGAQATFTGSLSTTLKIWDAPAGGNLLFSEVQMIPIINGLFNVDVGSVTPGGIPPTVLQSGPNRWLDVVIPSQTPTPRLKLGASPYALAVAGIHTSTNGYTGLGTSSPSQPLEVNGTIKSSAGGFMFPDGTVQASAFSTSTLVSALNNVGQLNLEPVFGTPGQQASQIGEFILEESTGDFQGRAGVGGLNAGLFVFGAAHDISNTAPFYEQDAAEFEAAASGSGVNTPNFRLISVGGQSWIQNGSPADTVHVSDAADFWGRGPYVDATCFARPGTITVNPGSMAVVGVGTNFSATDINLKLFSGYDSGTLNNALSGGVIASVADATHATLASPWTIGARTGQHWTTTALSATGACGGTSTIQNAISGVFTQPMVGTLENYAVEMTNSTPEQPIYQVFSPAGVSGPAWYFGTASNPYAQSEDLGISGGKGDQVLRFQNSIGGTANTYINSVGVGSVVINAEPTFAGEGPPQHLGTGGLKVGGGDVAISSQGKGLILTATDDPTKCFRVTVNSAGTLSSASTPCP